MFNLANKSEIQSLKKQIRLLKAEFKNYRLNTNAEIGFIKKQIEATQLDGAKNAKNTWKFMLWLASSTGHNSDELEETYIKITRETLNEESAKFN